MLFSCYKKLLTASLPTPPSARAVGGQTTICNVNGKGKIPKQAKQQNKSKYLAGAKQYWDLSDDAWRNASLQMSQGFYAGSWKTSEEIIQGGESWQANTVKASGCGNVEDRPHTDAEAKLPAAEAGQWFRLKLTRRLIFQQGTDLKHMSTKHASYIFMSFWGFEISTFWFIGNINVSCCDFGKVVVTKQ